jgi:invasion protein IalB
MYVPMEPVSRSAGNAIIALATVAVIVVAAAGSSFAQEFKPIGNFGTWEAYAGKEKTSSVCYMGSEPRKARGKYKHRGQTLVVITHRPAEKSTNVVNIQAGYQYRKRSSVQLIIDGATFDMFTDGGNAWAADANTDAALVRAMRAGSTMVVQGMSSRGTVTTDTYSLKGFSAAHNTMSTACKVKAR